MTESVKKYSKKEKVFWFHYNKPLSKMANKPQISIHYNKTCYIVDNIVCEIATSGNLRKFQPYFVIKGKCKSFEIKNNIAYLK